MNPVNNRSIFLTLVMLAVILPIWGENAFAVESPELPALDSKLTVIPGGAYGAGFDPDRAYRMCQRQHPGSCSMSWFEDEAPSRRIVIDLYQIDRYEVTQNQFEAVMKSNPSQEKGAQLPVVRITWHEAHTFCKKVGKRLPTEAEWEKAALGGVKTVYPWGDRFASGRANHCDLYCSKRWRETEFKDGFPRSGPVGSFPPNGYGVYDMTGNVYEWVADWYDEDYYAIRPAHNPQGPEEGSKKVIRGGSWINFSVGIRPTDRTEADPDDRMTFTGFRCAR